MAAANPQIADDAAAQGDDEIRTLDARAISASHTRASTGKLFELSPAGTVTEVAAMRRRRKTASAAARW